MPKNEGAKGNPGGQGAKIVQSQNGTTQPPTYAELNINKKDASKWQGMAENKEIISKKIEECTEQKKPIKENEIVREIKREQKKEEINNIANTPPKKPDGLYEVIVIDPPWPMEKVERECRPNQVQSLDYPVMTEDELKSFNLPLASDCHVWLWTTHKFLPMAFRLLEHWQLKYVCCFTWHKKPTYADLNIKYKDASKWQTRFRRYHFGTA